MPVREPSPSPAAFPSRRAYGWLAIAASIFVIYVSLIPFQFRSIPLDVAWRSFRAEILTTWGPAVSRTNFLANVLLFVPIGFLASGALLADRLLGPAAAAAIGAVLTWTIGVSFAAEFLQVFEPDRIPAAADVWAQALGAVIGITGWLMVGPHLTNWLRATAMRSRDDRLARVLGGYVLVWIFMQLAPFDFVVDLGFIARRARALLAEPISWREAGLAPARPLWNAAATTIGAAPIGAAFLITGVGRHERRSILSAIGCGCAIVAAIETAQFVLSSHAPSITDLLFGCTGVAIGVAVSARVLARSEVRSPSRASTLARVALVCWAGFVIAYHWHPYDFSFDSQLVQRKLASVSLLPFAAYYRGSELTAFSDVLLKIWLALPLGAAAGWALFRRAPAPVAFTTWFITATFLFSGIEAGQLLLPSRFPDPSDVLIGVVTSGLGFWLSRWLASGDSSGGGTR